MTRTPSPMLFTVSDDEVGARLDAFLSNIDAISLSVFGSTTSSNTNKG